MIFPLQFSSWKAALFPPTNVHGGSSSSTGSTTSSAVVTYTDTCTNMTSLSSLAHDYHTRARFALKPMSHTEDKKTITCAFYWLNPDAEDTDYLTDPTLVSDTHVSADNPKGYHNAIIPRHDADSKQHLASGDLVVLRTEDPESMPLPDWDLLWMQWRLQILVAISGEAERPARHLMPLMRPRFVHPQYDWIKRVRSATLRWGQRSLHAPK